MSVASVSAVVPVYNSARVLPKLCERVTAVMEATGIEYEVLLVDDGSTDGSWRQIERLAAADARIRGVALMRNYGQHNALLAGVRAARGAAIVTLDDDLQNPPEEIPKLLARLEDGWDVVYGSARERQHGFWRNLGTVLTRLALSGAIGSDIARKASAFRAFRTELRDAFAAFQGPFVSLDVLLSWGTARFDAVRVAHDPRGDGRSNYSFGKLVTHALTMLTGFSTRPLRLASLIGIVFTLFGFAVLVYVVTRFFIEGENVPGFPFLASIIAIFSGAQMLTLGIIGEYLARTHDRTMDRPAYAVRAEVGARALDTPVAQERQSAAAR